ncbi:response regulator [Azospirillum sp. sgz301742]
MRLLPQDTAERVAAVLPAGWDVFTPADLTHGIALELVEVAAAKGLWLDSTIDPAAPIRARGDASGIRRALRALAGHALTTTERGHVTVSLTTEPAEPGRCSLVFSITDTAPVLTPDQRRRLAEPLLALGRVGCEVRPEGGNRVWFAVPVEALPADRTPESTDARLERLTAWAQGRGGRILVVDDSATNRVITAALLNKAGFATTLAEGGAEGVRLMAEGTFDAVLMDVAMPDVDGMAATAAIRALPAPRAGVPIIAMTAHGFPEDRDRCLAAGMDDYLAKPFRTLGLLEALARHLA